MNVAVGDAPPSTHPYSLLPSYFVETKKKEVSQVKVFYRGVPLLSVLQDQLHVAYSGTPLACRASGIVS